jgi:acetolactate synthase-1/2/3 large subunit
MWDERGPFARRSHSVISINIDPSRWAAGAARVAMQADAGERWRPAGALGDAPALSVEADWLSRIRAVRARYDAKLRVMAGDREETMHPAALAQAIATALPADALAVYDGGHTTFWSNDLTPAHEVRTRFHEPGMSHLGFGLPYALSLKLQQPHKAVVNITGDGSFGFTLNELDTARRHKLPVINIIHNNAAWGIIRAGQRMALDFEMGTALEDTDYAAVARGFGCHGESGHPRDDVGPALERAFASGLPAVLDCRTSSFPIPPCRCSASMNRFGFDALTRPTPRKENSMNDIRMLIAESRRPRPAARPSSGAIRSMAASPPAPPPPPRRTR